MSFFVFFFEALTMMHLVHGITCIQVGVASTSTYELKKKKMKMMKFENLKITSKLYHHIVQIVMRISQCEQCLNLQKCVS